MIKKIAFLIRAGWKKLGYGLGQVAGLIIFSIIYFLAIGFYALLAFPIRRLSHIKTQSTFWEDKPYRRPSLENLEKQF